LVQNQDFFLANLAYSK